MKITKDIVNKEIIRRYTELLSEADSKIEEKLKDLKPFFDELETLVIDRAVYAETLRHSGADKSIYEQRFELPSFFLPGVEEEEFYTDEEGKRRRAPKNVRARLVKETKDAILWPIVNGILKPFTSASLYTLFLETGQEPYSTVESGANMCRTWLEEEVEKGTIARLIDHNDRSVVYYALENLVTTNFLQEHKLYRH